MTNYTKKGIMTDYEWITSVKKKLKLPHSHIVRDYDKMTDYEWIKYSDISDEELADMYGMNVDELRAQIRSIEEWLGIPSED